MSLQLTDKQEKILKVLLRDQWTATARVCFKSGIKFYEAADILFDLHDRRLIELKQRGTWKFWRLALNEESALLLQSQGGITT